MWVFRQPDQIVETADLSRNERIALLHEWETDLRLLMVATEENMVDAESGRTAELLREVHECLRRLGVPNGDGARSAPDRAGGGYGAGAHD
jgi:hypothetical protein